MGKQHTPESFWKLVDRTSSGPCWWWLGKRDRGGYGVVRYQTAMSKAHRIAWQITNGPIPAGLHLDHLCRNPRCVNPGHLEPVTAAENKRRAEAVKTACPSGHPYSGDNLILSGPRKVRVCRTCRNDRTKEYKRTKRRARGAGHMPMIGTTNPRARLTEADARAIFDSPESQAVLSKRYGVSDSLIYMIKNKKTWRHLHSTP